MRPMVFDRYGELDVMSLRDVPVPETHEVVVPRGLGLTCKTTTVQTTRQSLAVSVLDLVAMRAGEPATSAIARSVELARHVEQLAYKRYWVGEHHSIQGLACSATPVLIGHIAAATRTIRVGSGGVMLPNHAPLLVAEQFGTLEAMVFTRSDCFRARNNSTTYCPSTTTC
jgi:hypothetical protein